MNSYSTETFNSTETFEFEALEVARNYRQAILNMFAPYMGVDVLEIGAGIGQFSQSLIDTFQGRHFTFLEPCDDFFTTLSRQVPEASAFHGTVADLPQENCFDTVVSINVLEHIEEDQRELELYYQRLVDRKGTFCVFTPARPELYAPLDRAFGHYRRYTRRELTQKLETAGFQVEFCRYFNFPGYFLWLLEFKLLKQKEFNIKKVRIFDRCLFPLIQQAERIIPPPLGQSVVAVARALPS